jgi:pantetheine-phosphate adenylyltransferase
VRRAVYAGSFDPPTRGHLYVLQTGARLFDELIVAVGTQPEKAPAFALAERLGFLKACARGLKNVTVEHFAGKLLVDYARAAGAQYLLRGVRNPGDFEYERMMRQVNGDLAPELTTVFVMPPRELAEISASFVKGLVGLKGWRRAVRRMVPAPVYQAFLKRVRG